MKKLTLIASLCALSVGLFAATAKAGSTSFTTTGYNYPSSPVTNTWNVSTPSTTSISASVTLTVYGYFVPGAGSASVTQGGSTVFSVTASGTNPGNVYMKQYSNSGTVSNLAGGNYVLTQPFGGPTDSVDANISTTFSW